MLLGGTGNDNLQGGGGNDKIIGGVGADIIDVSQGSDVVLYQSILDGGDTIHGFDAAGADKDVISLDDLFDELGVATAERAGRIDVDTSSNTHVLRVDTTDDGIVSYDLVVATVYVVDGNVLNIYENSANVQYGSF